MKTIRTYINVAEAGFAVSLLEAAGIKALLHGEESFLMTPGLATGGIRLQVEPEDEERAVRLLEEGFAADQTEPTRKPAVAETVDVAESEKPRLPIAPFAAAFAVLALLVVAVQQLRESETRRASIREETVTADYNEDGNDDQFYTYRGALLTHCEYDRNFDGKLDSWTRYDGLGREESLVVDYDFDGRPDYWASCHKGVVQTWKRDTDFDGKPDYFGSCKDGQTAVAEYRPGDATLVARRQFWASELLREEQVDEDLDGKMDYRIVFDAFGTPSAHLPISDGK